MRDAGVEGTVRVKALIDTDGLVKRAVALNDLGHGAARLAAEACLEARFEPAMRGGEPAAVWIIIPIRFELLD
jgi:TonB family protein